MFSTTLFKSYLNTKIIANKIFYYSSTLSTNNVVWDIIKNESKEGIVVIANNQTKGRGRGEKKWISKKNMDILCSFSMKQKFDISKMGLHALAIPIGIINGIKYFTDIPIKVKWPNDIYAKDKKIGGILIETKKIKNTIFFNIGFGINVNESEEDFPDSLKKNAISLRMLTNENIQREILLAKILNSLDNIITEKKESFIIDNWMKYCNHIDNKINRNI